MSEEDHINDLAGEPEPEPTEGLDAQPPEADEQEEKEEPK